jgi:hypothetical protein
VSVATDKTSELLLALRSNCREIYLLPKEKKSVSLQKGKNIFLFLVDWGNNQEKCTG